MAAHLYWRILCNGSVNGSYAGFAEIALKSAPGGTNLCTGGTAASSSNYSGSYTPDKAVDGSLSTLWHSGSGLPQWWSYAFASAVDINTVDITSRSGENGVCPSDFDVQYSDDNVNWTTLFSVTGLDPWGSNETRGFYWDGTTVKGDTTTLRVNQQYAYVVARGGKGVKVNQQYAYIVARGGKGLKVNTQYAYVVARVAVMDPGGGGGGGAATWLRAAQIIG